MKSSFVSCLVAITFLLLPSDFAFARTSEQDRIFATVKLEIFDNNKKEYLGSGTGLIISKNRVLTAFHVVSPIARNAERFDAYVCISFSHDEKPECHFIAEKVEKFSETYDLATIVISRGYDPDLDQYIDWSQYKSKYDATEYLNPTNYINQHSAINVSLGQDISAFGYPAVGGENITLTKGVISGIQKGIINGREEIVDIRTDAKLNHGNSGGPVFTELGEFVGLVLATSQDISDIGHIAPISVIRNFLRSSQERIRGEVCYDYVNGKKKEEKCFCNTGYVFDSDAMFCNEVGGDSQQIDADTTDEQESEDEVKPHDESDQAQDVDDSVIEDNSEADEIGNKDDASELNITNTKPHILSQSLRDVIIEMVLSCKSEVVWGDKIAYRKCIKTGIKDFIKERNLVKRKLRSECRDEGYSLASDIKMCVDQKIR